MVLLISAEDDAVLRDSARDYGAVGFVSKEELRPGILRARVGAPRPRRLGNHPAWVT